MITVNGQILKPTFFPDGTSQIWELPFHLLDAKILQIDWRFAAEREILDLFSLRELLPDSSFHLYMPYLPYGRQDKDVDNLHTFNFHMFGELLAHLKCRSIETLDAHNPRLAKAYGVQNIQVDHIQQKLIDEVNPTHLVFPDQGAAERYEHPNFKGQIVLCDKIRDPATGEISGHSVAATIGVPYPGAPRFLIIDDICDGGATFISVANLLRGDRLPKRGAWISLFTTHGIYSKGRAHLLENGIDCLYTTNSLPRNNGIPGVIKV